MTRFVVGSIPRTLPVASSVTQTEPPPNPAKLSDSRSASYVETYGYESWELDALEPTVLGQLIQDAIDAPDARTAFARMTTLLNQLDVVTTLVQKSRRR